MGRFAKKSGSRKDRPKPADELPICNIRAARPLPHGVATPTAPCSPTSPRTAGMNRTDRPLHPWLPFYPDLVWSLPALLFATRFRAIPQAGISRDARSLARPIPKHRTR